MNSEKEYDRISAEILQDQNIRVTIFTFSIATMAGIIGFSEKLKSSGDANSDGLLIVLVISLYVVLVPSVLLVYNFTRGINLKSEYLKVFHKESWMIHFDILTQQVIPNSNIMQSKYSFITFIKAYTTEQTLIITYNMLNVIILIFGLIKLSGENKYCYLLFVGLFIVTTLLIYGLKPIKKIDYAKLWLEVSQNVGKDGD